MSTVRQASAGREAIFARANAAVTEELEVELTLLEGELPEELRGVHLRNGPGKQEAFGTPYQHLFDGDGMITRFAFDGRGVRYQNRYVRTREYLEERAAEAMLYRGFGTNLPGGLRKNALRMRYKNAANTSLVYHAGRLYALWEGGLPHRVSPHDLTTLAREDFGHSLQNHLGALDQLLMPELPFSAHPCLDPQTGELFNFGVAFGLKSRLLLYRIDAEGMMYPPVALELPRMAFVHDFVLTRHYQIFFLAPVDFDVPRTLAGFCSPVEALRQDRSRQTTIWVVPRDGSPLIELKTRAGFMFHFAGGWEEDGDPRKIVIDGCRMDQIPDAALAQRLMRGESIDYDSGALTRYRLDLDAGTVSEQALGQPGLGVELPTINPRFALRAQRYAWAMGVSPKRKGELFESIIKIDRDTGAHLELDLYPDLPGEPLFVPRPEGSAEDDGWLLSVVYRAGEHRSELLVLDAADLSICARLALPHHLPPGFHSIWIAEDELV